jgi:hypothetical protein
MDLFAYYVDYCEDAVESFWLQHVQCEFTEGPYRCVNFAANHKSKGHQDARGSVQPGKFVSSFQPKHFFPLWSGRVKREIYRVDAELQEALRRDRGSSKEACLLELHNRTMRQFYRDIGAADHFLSHYTCLCCLMQPPQHALRCGHVLCTQCVRAYGRPMDTTTSKQNVLSLDCCPLHPTNTRWSTPCIIRFKPEMAGVRLLCLDG